MLFETLITLAAAGAASESLPPVATTDPRPVRVVDVVAHDYAFTAPDTIEAGATTFRMTSHGKEPHHVVVVRFEGGRTLRDFVAYLQSLKPGEEKFPEWATELGGPNPEHGSEPASATIVLEPGNHALLCIIPSPDGKLHAAKGMMRPLTVVPARAAGGPAVLPAADRTMELRDYGFTLSSPLTAGRQTIRVVNAATTQWHEVALLRVLPGKTQEQVMHWLHTLQGEPAAELSGGVSPMAAGRNANVEVDLVPGTYVLICFLPDHKDGKPHFVHGMVQTIQVPAAR